MTREAAARVVARPFFGLLAVLAYLLPARALAKLAVGASGLVYRLFPRLRASLLRNAAVILGASATEGARERLARGVLESFARFLAELVAPSEESSRQDLRLETIGREHFARAAAPGRGVIAVSLHMGNYELASLELAALRPNVAVVYNRERIAFLERIRSRRRQARTLEEIVIDRSPFFGIEALQKLKEGGMVLLAGDQVEARDGKRVEFLGQAASFSLWPARLSLASGAPILPSFNVRRPDGRCRLHLEPPIFPGDHADPASILNSTVRVFERYVRDYPDQWLMIRPFWLSTAGGPGPADAGVTKGADSRQDLGELFR
jgi:KDO2-lipid IV(A) lauroyltransferase